jgi:WD40 repeat protein
MEEADLIRELSGTRRDFIAHISTKQNELKDLIENLRKENASLRAHNEQLKAENAHMEGAAYTPAAPAPAPGTTYTPAPGRSSRHYQEELPEGDPRAAYVQSKVMRTHEAPVHSVNFCRSAPRVMAGGGVGSSGLLASASWDANIHIYDLNQDDKAALVRTLGGDEETCDMKLVRMGGLYDVQFAPTNPGILAAASADNFVYLWHYERNMLITRLHGHTDEVNGVAFHPSQQVICTTSDDTTAMIWDFHEGIKLRVLEGHVKAAYGATFLGAKCQFNVATCSFDQKVRVYDMRDKSIVATLQEHYDEVIGIDFSESKNWLASGSDDGRICVWDIRAWATPLFKIDTRKDSDEPENEVKRVKFNPDGTKLAAGSSSKQALVYNLTGTSPQVHGILVGQVAHTDCIFDCCFGVDGQGGEFIVDASHDQTCSMWVPRR